MSNSYQAEVLADPAQKYWVEALKKPFYLQFSAEEETSIANATQILGRLCKEYLDWFFTEDRPGAVDERLEKLAIRREYWTAMKLSWEREEPIEDLTLYLRFDFSMPENGGPPKLLEINGETPLLGAEQVYQWNWLDDMKRIGAIPKNTNQFNEFWELVSERWRYIIEAYGLKGKVLSFLIDERLNEDREMAAQLVQIIQDTLSDEQYCQIVNLRDDLDDNGEIIQRGISMDDEGWLIDHFGERMPVVWKIYDWSDLTNDVENFGMTKVFARHLETGEQKFLEPLWKQVLSNKGSLAYIWEQFGSDPVFAPFLLETYFENDLSPEATRLLLTTHVKKPLLGLEGVATEVRAGVDVTVAQRDSLGYGGEGFVIQEYAPLPTAHDYYYMIGAWLVGGLEDGEAAGFVIRGDRSQITGRYCLIIPHVVSDNLLLAR